MGIEAISSRKNQHIVRLRSLAADGAFRREQGEYLCDGIKLLREALAQGADLRTVLWKEQAEALPGLEGVKQYVAPADLFDYASPMKNSPGPVFTVAIPGEETDRPLENAIVLENVQDPGNVGTVLRTAKALGVQAVVLVGACADVYSPKAARATMGRAGERQSPPPRSPRTAPQARGQILHFSSMATAPSDPVLIIK